MKQLKLLTIGMAVGLLSGCAEWDIPPCGNQATISLVKEIAADNIAGAKNGPIEMKFIKKEGTNDETGEFTCSATLKIGEGESAKEIPIGYTSGIGQTESGEKQHLVTMFEL